MSLQKAKEQLIQSLSEADNIVIALSGKWGTGKTHLWTEVKTEVLDDKVKNALYVSLFGLSSIDQLKRKLIEASVPGVESHGGVFDGLKNLFNSSVEAASKHYKALAAINNVNLLLMAPAVLRNKLIVIDDIERKYEKLGINEVLGFIDEYSRQHGSRFILVLNDDQLSTKRDQSELWTTFREKIIDHEIKLSTTAEEAFSIAIAMKPSKYEEAIQRASVTCGLTNIRIVMRVIKAANQILASRDLEESILGRVVPSIVLFSGIYYRGLEDGPDFKFALNVGNPDWAYFGRDSDHEPTPQEKMEDGWRMLMQELGIHGCDELEERLVEFLESGLFESAKIEAIIDRYVAEKEAMEARKTAQDFLFRSFWDHRVDEEQLVEEATAFPKIAGLLDPFVVSGLYTELSAMRGGDAIGTLIIDAWIKVFRESKQSVSVENPFNNPIDQRIQAELDAIEATTQDDMNVVDACLHVVEHSGWGTLQEVALSRASVADFEAAIRETEDLHRLGRFMRQMIKMRLNRATYDPHFGTATEHFVEACRSIANDSSSPRLANLIKALFKKPSMESELSAQP
ncbi:P-loop NTPase fold protein [uncultured Marinobacter sp.]|uniref:P-loop NTPase fold protein n=1 Tax=uncultured Marinobacter sp. TaxID=187379 RepID=UPI0030DC4174